MERQATDRDDELQVRGSTRADVVDVVEPLRRYVAAHTFQPADAEDVVQETVTRLLELGEPLAPDSAVAYALVTARHLLADEARAADRHRRHAHRLVDPARPPLPDEIVVDDEEHRALREALAAVPAEQRDLLIAHVLEDEPLAAIAAGAGRSDSSLAAQLARTRARLRLDYVLALRGTTLPTARCRPILLALSAGDTRRQAALRTGEHLLSCPACADLARPLLRRRSALAAVLPWLGLGPLLLLLRRLFSQRPVQIASAVTAVVAGGAATALYLSAPAATPAPTPPPSSAPSPTVSASPAAEPLTRSDDGRSLSALGAADGVAVTGTRMRVAEVPADEGFWVLNGPERVWIQLRAVQGESRARVRTGDTVTFTGRVVAHDAGFAGRVGVSAAEGARLLTRQGAHVSVAVGDLSVDAS